MRSILGIIKDGASANDMVYSSDFKAEPRLEKTLTSGYLSE